MILPLINEQPWEKVDHRTDGTLDVISVFPTIQGEGPYAGRPAVFVRLAGCTLTCPACDTLYTTGRERKPIVSLLEQIDYLTVGKALVVLTGGEPFRQNILPLIDALTLEYGIQVQIETNGTIYLERFQTFYLVRRQWINVVCSPKTPSIHPRLRQCVDALKYIVKAGEIDSDGLPLTALGMPYKPMRPWKDFKGEVYVQPQDDKDELINKANIDDAVQSCIKHGYRLSLQSHKYLNLE